MEFFSNKVINVVDLFVFVALFSKDSDPGYTAVSLRTYAGLDNDVPLSCCPLTNDEIMADAFCGLVT